MVSLHLKTWFHGGRVSGPLNEAPSILSGVPSKTCLPCLGTLPPSFYRPSPKPPGRRAADSFAPYPAVFRGFSRFLGKQRIWGLTAGSTFRMVALPMSMGEHKRPDRAGKKRLTPRPECPRLISPPRDRLFENWIERNQRTSVIWSFRPSDGKTYEFE